MQTATIETGAVRGWLDDALDRLEPGQPLGPGEPTKIGVVFVHGIGSQRPGATLLDWSDRLLRVVGTWSASTGGPFQLVRRANIDFTGATIPYVEIELPAAGDAHPAETWILTEAYWAARIRPPSIGEMVRWLVGRGEGLRVLAGVARGVSGTFGLRAAIVDTALVRALLLAAVLLAFAAFAVTRVLRLIPIGALRESVLVRSFDYFLGDWFGDIRVMLLDRVQAANVRSRLRRAIYALRARGCGPIVLVGHSGGTFVSYMTLIEKPDSEVPATRLVTHGQALGLVWNLGDACQPPDPTVEDRLQDGDLLRTRLREARPGLEWSDFWASHDPAPAGGFELAPCVVDRPDPERSHRVVNRASIRADHTAYWNNTEQFVVPLARLIETARAGSTGSRLFSDERLATAQERRTVRVGELGVTRIGITLAGLLALVVAVVQGVTGSGHLGALGRDVHAALAWLATPLAALNDALHWLALPGAPTDALAVTEALALGVVALAAAFRAQDAVWDGWDDANRTALLAARAWPPTGPMRAQLALVAIAAVLLVGFVGLGSWAALGAASAVALVAVGWAAVSAGRAAGPAPAPVPAAAAVAEVRTAAASEVATAPADPPPLP